MTKKLRKSLGFTLIELLLVISIISILSGITIANIRLSQVRSQDSRRQNDVGTIVKAIQTYYLEHGDWPRMTASQASSNDNIMCVSIPPAPPQTVIYCDYSNGITTCDSRRACLCQNVDGTPVTKNWFPPLDGGKFPNGNYFKAGHAPIDPLHERDCAQTAFAQFHYVYQARHDENTGETIFSLRYVLDRFSEAAPGAPATNGSCDSSGECEYGFHGDSQGNVIPLHIDNISVF